MKIKDVLVKISLDRRVSINSKLEEIIAYLNMIGKILLQGIF